MFYFIFFPFAAIKEQMIQIPLLQVEMSTNYKRGFAGVAHFHDNPSLFRGSTQRLWSPSWENSNISEGSHRALLEKRASLARSLLLQAGTHGRQKRMAVVRLDLVWVPCCYFSIPQSGFHSDWLIPQMDSSSYQSPWRPQEPCCSRQDCLGEKFTDVRLYF